MYVVFSFVGLKGEVNFFLRKFIKVFYFRSAFIIVIFKRDFLEVSVLGKCFQLLGIKFIISLYLLWLELGKSSFSSNSVEEIRPGCRNIHWFLITVNLSEIFLGRMQQKHGLSELKYSLLCRFKNIGWSRILLLQTHGKRSCYWWM